MFVFIGVRTRRRGRVWVTRRLQSDDTDGVSPTIQRLILQWVLAGVTGATDVDTVGMLGGLARMGPVDPAHARSLCRPNPVLLSPAVFPLSRLLAYDWRQKVRLWQYLDLTGYVRWKDGKGQYLTRFSMSRPTEGAFVSRPWMDRLVAAEDRDATGREFARVSFTLPLAAAVPLYHRGAVRGGPLYGHPDDVLVGVPVLGEKMKENR